MISWNSFADFSVRSEIHFASTRQGQTQMHPPADFQLACHNPWPSGEPAGNNREADVAFVGKDTI
jgi:hypothetical protein